MLVGGILAGESGIHQELRQVGRRDVLAGPEIDRDIPQARRSADAWQEGRSRRNDNAGAAAGQAVECSSSRRSDANVRGQSPVRVDLVGGKRENRAVDRHRRQAFERREKESHVHRRLIDVGVAGHDVQNDASWTLIGGGSHQEGLGCRARAGHDGRGSAQTAARDRGLQKSAEI